VTIAEVLLVPHVLVGGDEDIKLTFSEPEKLPILNAGPSACSRGGAFVPCKDFVHRPRRTFIEQNFHCLRHG
jgi:hypothetical protein